MIVFSEESSCRSLRSFQAVNSQGIAVPSDTHKVGERNGLYNDYIRCLWGLLLGQASSLNDLES